MAMPEMPASEYIKVDVSAVGGPSAVDQACFSVFPKEFRRLDLVGFETAALNEAGHKNERLILPI